MSQISYFGSGCHSDGRVYRRQKIELNRARLPRVICGSISRAAKSQGGWRKRGERELSSCRLTGDIRRTFCDGLVELAHCRSESRTCLMELEPFWKFDRREQPASRSSMPLLCPLAIVFFRSYSLFFFASKSSSFSFSRIPFWIRVAFPTLIWFRVLLFFSLVLCSMQ